MRHFDDPGQMTAEQRSHEIASILAAGLLRLKKHADFSAKFRQVCRNPQESATGGLEVSGETRLSGRAG